MCQGCLGRSLKTETWPIAKITLRKPGDKEPAKNEINAAYRSPQSNWAFNGQWKCTQNTLWLPILRKARVDMSQMLRKGVIEYATADWKD